MNKFVRVSKKSVTELYEYILDNIVLEAGIKYKISMIFYELGFAKFYKNNGEKIAKRKNEETKDSHTTKRTNFNN